MDTKAGFEGGEDNPNISWIDGKDNGDETQYSGDGSEARKNRSGSDCGGNGLIGNGIDLRVEDSGYVESSVLEMIKSIVKMKKL